MQEARVEAAEARIMADGLRRTQRLSAALVVVGIGGWPGAEGASATPFCEAFRPGPIKQPAITPAPRPMSRSPHPGMM